jgi:demethylmenaquinone methyltransferase/2-methoxy-6-polyprenyl-1,4-benzoquinol methylase
MSTSPVAAMFDRISPSYDQLNHWLSLNIDKLWRRKTAKEVAKNHPKTILDLATGTADLAMEIAKRNPEAHIIGTDISEKMLEIGESKIKKQHLENQIELHVGDAAALPFKNNSFDAVTVAFGVRNFENLKQGLSEIHRVLKPNGHAFILEFSMPEKFPIKQAYRLYFKHLLPRIGKTVSKDENAYTYLPESVKKFPKPDTFCKVLSSFGLENIKAKSLTFGVAVLYSAQKR